MLQCRRVAVAKFGEQCIVPVVMQSQSLNRPNVPQPPIRPGRPNPQRFNLCPAVTKIKVVALTPEIRGLHLPDESQKFSEGVRVGRRLKRFTTSFFLRTLTGTLYFFRN